MSVACRARFFKELQAVERFLGERFRFLKFGLFVIRSARADRDACICRSPIKNAPEPIADPISIVSQALDLFGRGALLLLVAGLRLAFFVFVRIKLLFPKIFWTALAALLRVRLYECQGY